MIPNAKVQKQRKGVDGMEQYSVTGMSCAACSARVEMAVSKVPGVTACSVSLLTNSMGVEGTAFATLFSQTFAAIGVMIHLYRLKKTYALRIRFSDCSLKEFTDILKVGVPAGVQSIIITLSNIIIQSQINTLGVTSVASFTVYFRVELIIYLPIVALGQAVVSFIGQNFGAGNWERIK